MTTTHPARTRPTGRCVRIGAVSVRIDARALAVCLALLVAIVAVAAVTLTTGDFHVPLGHVFGAITGTGQPGEVFIVRTLRLPRLVTGLLVGAALGIGGALFQSLSRNPLGSPDVVGFTTGAATGALLVILVWGGSGTQISAGAVVGGVGTALAVYVMAIKRGVQGYRLILIGIGVAAMLASVNSFLLTRAELTEAQSAASWLVGSLNGRDWSDARPIAIALVVLLPAALWLARGLRLLEFGDDLARALGVGAERTRLLTVIVGVGLTALATASAGPVAFVALAAPQVAKRLTRAPGPNVVAAGLTGALLLSASDLAAQRVFDTQLPVGVMTGAVGGLYLAWLLTGEYRRGRA